MKHLRIMIVESQFKCSLLWLCSSLGFSLAQQTLSSAFFGMLGTFKMQKCGFFDHYTDYTQLANYFLELERKTIRFVLLKKMFLNISQNS